MRKQVKKKVLLFFIALLILIVLVIIFYFLVLQTAFVSNGTAYQSYSISDSGKTLTLSNFWKYDGFRTNHYLSGECDLAGGCHMYDHSSPYYLYYLRLNGIDSTKFSLGGYKVICAFTPKDWQTYATNCYWDESDACTYCGTGDYWGEDYQKIKDLGFTWYAGKTHCFTGGTISQANLNSHISKLTCSVTGTVTQLCEGSQIISTHCVSHNQPYNLKGVVKTTSTGYYCEIDMAELNDLLPSQIMIPSRDTLQPRGIIAVGNPKVIFKFAQEKVFYRFENNQCNSIIIMENTKLFNDYNTLVECQENIIEIEEIFYRFQDNTCITVNILESEKTVSDYYTLSECQENIVEIEETFYRFQDNTCIIVNILPSEKTVNDYITLVECQGNIIEGEGCE